jgi:HAD superfamily hydrolase (TIGR01509 family)
MIRGLVFDFDGLILETESAIYQSWVELYEVYGCELQFDAWANTIGTAESLYDPFDELEKQVGKPLDRKLLEPSRRQRELYLIRKLPPMPGVEHALKEGKRAGLKIGLASSSNCAWVTGHLVRLKLIDYFDSIMASDDVGCTKPSPELYLAALADLGLSNLEAVAFEDSPNGILAAKRAGMFCVAVPSEMTRRLDTSLADLHLGSLEEMPLQKILAIAGERLTL